MNQQALSSFIWSVADLLRGDYKQSDYGKVILPFTVLRRLDCVLESTKPAVLAEHAVRKKQKLNAEPFLLRKAKQSFYNTSPMDMKKLSVPSVLTPTAIITATETIRPASRTFTYVASIHKDGQSPSIGRSRKACTR